MEVGLFAVKQLLACSGSVHASRSSISVEHWTRTLVRKICRPHLQSIHITWVVFSRSGFGKKNPNMIEDIKLPHWGLTPASSITLVRQEMEGWMETLSLIYPNVKMQYFGIQKVFVFNVEAPTRVHVDGTQQTAAIDVHLRVSKRIQNELLF